jgi:hypothetical protein
MDKRVKDLTGRTYGRLTVIGYSHVNGKTAVWNCRCSCGTEKTVRSTDLKSGSTQSCGCLHREKTVTHGKTKSRCYRIWRGMIQRCTNPNHELYHNYGGRGVTVSDDWRSFELFYRDMGDPPDDALTLERKDNDVGYCAGNCVWATWEEQSNNKRNSVFLEYDGKRQTIAQWAREYGFDNPSTLRNRVHRGWLLERALTEPIQRNI